MNTKTSILMAKARRPLGCGVRKFGILLTVMATAIIALPNTVTNDVVVATSDAELRISDRGLGLGLEVVGGGAAEVKLETRPGWRFRDGSTSVTLNKAAGEPAKSPAIEGEGNGAENYVPGVDVNDDENGGDENDEGSVDHEKPVLSLTATAPKVVAYSVLDGGTNVSISLSATVTTKGKHRKLDADGNVVEETEFLPKRYVWKMTGAATGEAETDSSTHTFVASLTKGKDKKLNFSVVGKICGICDGDVESDKATDSVEIAVYELSIDLPKEFLGLDLRDASKGEYVTCGASVKIEPEPPSVTYNWMDCGQCTFIGDTDKQDVVYGATGSNEGSSHYRAEPLTASVTIEGMDAAETCSTNFTVVKVDVVLSGVGEEGDEKKKPNVYYVPDNEDGSLSEFGLLSLMSVTVTCTPADVRLGTVELDVSSASQLYEISEYEIGESGRFEPVTADLAKKSYMCNEIDNVKFGIHGHIEKGPQAYDLMWAQHEQSKAIDIARVKVVQPPPLEVSVKFDSPAKGGGWPYDPVWDDPEWYLTASGWRAELCATDADEALVICSLSRDAKQVKGGIYEWGLIWDDELVSFDVEPTEGIHTNYWVMLPNLNTSKYIAKVVAVEKETGKHRESDSDIGEVVREKYYISSANEIEDLGIPHEVDRPEYEAALKLAEASQQKPIMYIITAIPLSIAPLSPFGALFMSALVYGHGELVEANAKLPVWFAQDSLLHHISWTVTRFKWEDGEYVIKDETIGFNYDINGQVEKPAVFEMGYDEVKYKSPTETGKWETYKIFYDRESVDMSPPTGDINIMRLDPASHRLSSSWIWDPIPARGFGLSCPYFVNSLID